MEKGNWFKQNRDDEESSAKTRRIENTKGNQKVRKEKKGKMRRERKSR